MSNSQRTRTAVILLLLTVYGGFSSTMQVAKPGERRREIKSDPRVPIADLLIPQDDVVVIERNSFPPLIGFNADQTLQDALDQAMLHDAIAVTRSLKSRGNLIDRGTWVRSTVTASVVEVIKPGPGLGIGAKTATFWHNDGEMFVGHVRVRAGVYPVYDPSEDYLLFLNQDPARGLYPARSFRITSKGLLAPIIQSNGETKLPNSPIYGQTSDLVLRELRERVSKR
jgi:hypothetical protein